MSAIRVPISEVARITSGKRPTVIFKEMTEDCIVPIVGGGGPSGFTTHAIEPEGVLITGRVGTLGKLHVAVEPCWPSDNALVLKPISKDIDQTFLRYAISEVIAEAKGLNRGAANPLLTQKDLGMLKVASFPLPEQREIACILGALDDKIELNRKTSSTLEAVARALYRSWFVDFDPVHARAEGRPPAHMPPQTAALFPDSFGDDGLPVGWKMGIVEDLFVLQRGFDLPATTRTNGDYPVYAAGGYHGTHNEFRVKGPGVTTGRSGVIGEVFLILEDFWPLNTSLWVKEFKRGSAYFAFFFMQMLDLKALNSGSAVPSLNRNNVHNLSADIPPEAIVDAFDQRLIPIFQNISSLSKQSQTLATLRDTLLPRLMSGELRVGAARAEVEATL